MQTISKQQALAYIKRFAVLSKYKKQERKKLSYKQKLNDFFYLMEMHKIFPQTKKIENEKEKTRKFWQKLRKKLAPKTPILS